MFAIFKLGIRVTSVNPAFIDTEFHTTEGINRDGEEYASMLEAVGPAHPIGRYGTVADCVNAIAFLANDKSSFLTGTLLLVDGGLGTKGPW